MRAIELAKELGIAQYDSGRMLFEAAEVERFYHLAQKEDKYLEFAVFGLCFLKTSDFGTPKAMREAVGLIMDELTRRLKVGNGDTATEGHNLNSPTPTVG